MLKQWLQTGQTQEIYKTMYLEAVKGIQTHLVQKTTGPLQLTYIAELINGGLSAKMVMIFKYSKLRYTLFSKAGTIQNSYVYYY